MRFQARRLYIGAQRLRRSSFQVDIGNRLEGNEAANRVVKILIYMGKFYYLPR